MQNFRNLRVHEWCFHGIVHVVSAELKTHEQYASHGHMIQLLSVDWLSCDGNADERTKGSSMSAIAMEWEWQKIGPALVGTEFFWHRGHKDDGDSRATKQNNCNDTLFEEYG
mgnify:CR=1 FL=1